MSSPVLGHLRRALGTQALLERIDVLERELELLRRSVARPAPLFMGDDTALCTTTFGAKLLVDTTDVVLAPWLLSDGLWEAQVTDWLQQILKPGHVFVDVGANIGYFTVLGGRLVGPSGHVVAVEAHPRLAALVQRNAVMNGIYPWVTTHEAAAWSTSTSLPFHVRVHSSSGSSAGSIGSERLAHFHDREEVLQVPTVVLDDVLADLPRVDVVKIDVEGAELQTVRGLERTIKANPGIVLELEWAPELLGLVGDAATDLRDLLVDHGFRFRLLEEGLAPVEPARLADIVYGNIVAAR